MSKLTDNATLEIRLKKTNHYFSSLPTEKVLSYLKDAVKQNNSVKGEYKSLLMRIEHLFKQTTSPITQLKASEADRIESLHLKQMTSFFIARKIGSMHCPDCHKNIDSGAIIFERYIRESTTGKRFYCKSNNHLILDLIDLKRAGEKNRLAEDFAHLLENISSDAS